MKVVQINATCGVGSTGKICVGISQLLSRKNIENYILYSSKSNGYDLGISCADDRYIKLQAVKSRIFGNYGFNSYRETCRMIEALERINPDIVHLHNIHGHDCNLETLAAYFRKKKTKLVWTFHDCWAFTGYCPYFTMVGCDKWKDRCYQCIQKGEYTWVADRSATLYEKKKKLLQGLDLTIVTPSRWLAGLVHQSFLQGYPIQVVNNGIDLDVYKPLVGDFREKNRLDNRKIVLGVALGWSARKGVDIFIELAQRLSDDYKIVLVGTDDKVDQLLPDNIISIHRTENQQELAEIYSAADVFVNPTREENYPTVNMEAIACGTPVLTFRTGGSPEMLDDTCGVVVDCDDIDALEREIIRICEKKNSLRESCLRKSEEFDQTDRFEEYVNLYEKIISGRNQGN